MEEKIPEPHKGSKITVYDGNKVELGEGTLFRKAFYPEMNLTVYECEEHDILARGAHWLKFGGNTYRILK